MTSVANVSDAFPSDEGTTWWYKDGSVHKGPASAEELRRLANIGILQASSLVWQEGSGPHWRRLAETELWQLDAAKGPPSDHGRWSKVFAKLDAKPEARPWSWLGFFLGPVAYFLLGMWTRGLIITSGFLAACLALIMVENAADYPTSLKIPSVLLTIFCSRSLKRDYYRFRILGERVWPSLRGADNVLACSAASGLLFLAVGFAQLNNAADSLSDDVAGVWENETTKVVNALDEFDKTITYDGVTHYVAIKSVDGAAGVIVFRDLHDPKLLITFQKRLSEDGKTYSLDFLVNDEVVGNLVYARPV